MRKRYRLGEAILGMSVAFFVITVVDVRDFAAMLFVVTFVIGAVWSYLDKR